MASYTKNSYIPYWKSCRGYSIINIGKDCRCSW